MTHFINNPYSDHHHGADRVEAVMDAAQHLPEGIAGKRGVALLLGSAMAAAVMAVAYEVMDSADESHLLMIWVGLWLALFALLAFFAGALRATGMRFKSSLDDWSRSIAEARADQRLWASGQSRPSRHGRPADGHHAQRSPGRSECRPGRNGKGRACAEVTQLLDSARL